MFAQQLVETHFILFVSQCPCGWVIWESIFLENTTECRNYYALSLVLSVFWDRFPNTSRRKKMENKCMMRGSSPLWHSADRASWSTSFSEHYRADRTENLIVCWMLSSAVHDAFSSARRSPQTAFLSACWNHNPAGGRLFCDCERDGDAGEQHKK